MAGRLLIRVVALAGGLALLPASAGAATIEVDVTNDELNADADCSLREGVQAANTNQAVSGCAKGQGRKRDTIKLVPGEQHELTIASTDEDGNADGDLDFNGGGPVTLKGNARGMGGPAVSATAGDRVIDARQDVEALTVKKLNLEGGNVGAATGGVIRANLVDLTIEDVNLEHGAATSGGAVDAFKRTVTVKASFLGQNDATVSGGAIHTDQVKELRVTNSGIDSNDVLGVLATGGGIDTDAKVVTIVDTQIEFNGVETNAAAGSAAGGGINANSDELVIRRSLFVGNDALDVGGVSTSFGAGIRAIDGLRVVNSTFWDNDAEEVGGAIFADGGSVTNATFSGNDVPGSGDHLMSSSDPPLTLRNSILAGMGADLCAGGPGAFVSKGYSVAEGSDPDCGFTGRDEIVTDAGLDPGGLLPNGGPTLTVGIEGTSPAKNLIPKSKCEVAQGEDQRDFKRPKGKKCDAGAFERGATAPEPSVV